ncbi:MAG: hypothetical protein GTN64_05445 [Candidatus Latescibacteria bacterium]|nr:hypothetical protein [Candidatus Latescibacterota bacterium]NIO78054.1 hypothetical protein [Candidatus Latescibacterota bacterium]
MRYLGSIRQTVAPINPAVTTAQIKQHLRINTASDDSYLDELIQAATIVVEGFLNRAIIDQTWQLTLERFPVGRVIYFERAPLKTVSSVDYNDADGNPQTFAVSNYTVDTERLPGRLVLKEDSTWPTVENEPNSVTITYTAGLGADETALDAAYQNIKLGIKMLVGTWYANRESIAVQVGLVQAAELPQSLTWLLSPWRVY